MVDRVYLGIDTSNYTTSVALLSSDGSLIANIKRPLPVKQGERGLRQADALFAHIKNLPSAMREAKEYLAGRSPAAIGVSEKPRNAEGSYMPCFLAGISAAESASAVTGAKIYRFSHQCGHIMAALYGSGRFDLLGKSFAAFHVSGGTTELVRVRSSSAEGFCTELLGGTKDVNAGQIIDRVGVLMGLSFPAGPAMEELALKNTKKPPVRRIRETDLSVNLSGVENLAAKLYAETGDRSLVADFTLRTIGGALISLSEGYENRYGKSEFVYAGGVISNSIIRSMLAGRFAASFAPPALSADNAVGVACLARYADEGGAG